MKQVLYLKGSPWLDVNRNEILSHKILSLEDLMLMSEEWSRCLQSCDEYRRLASVHYKQITLESWFTN